MPVEFLSDEQVGAYGRFTGELSAAEVERFFYLDDADRNLIARRRSDHHRLGFAVQLGTVRAVGRFLEDPLDVPWPAVEFLAGQLEIGNASCVKKYVQRPQTPYEHAWEIRDRYGYRSFDDRAARGRSRGFSRVGPGLTLRGRWPCSNRRRGGCVVIGGCCPASRCWRDWRPCRARQPRPACTRLWPQRPGAWIPGCRSGSRTCYRSRTGRGGRGRGGWGPPPRAR